MADDHFYVKWIDAEREPQCLPNPDYPKGIDLDIAQGRTPNCKIDLPYPAKRCGYYEVKCKLCGFVVIATTAGRPDDPCSVTVPCRSYVSGGKA